MIELTARPIGENIEVEITDSNLGRMTFSLDRYLGFAFLESIASALSKLPGDQTAPLHLQQPCLRSKHPSFQVGLRGTGDVVLSLRPDPLPPLEFDFSVEQGSILVAALREALITAAPSAASQ